MTDTTKLPEALRIAGILRVTGPRHMTSKWIGEAFLELERQHDRIAELEAQFEAGQVCGSQTPESEPQPGLSRTDDPQAWREHVAIVVIDHEGGHQRHTAEFMDSSPPDGTKLYAAPPAAPEDATPTD